MDRVLGQCREHHRASDIVDFLQYIDANTPRSMELHIITDNYSVHRTAEVKKFLELHPQMEQKSEVLPLDKKHLRAQQKNEAFS